MEIVRETSENSDLSWLPVLGKEVRELKSHLGWPNSALQKLEEETVEIMQFCGNPERPSFQDTGLVLGFVQSGKTVSFTTLTALARDNSYQLVIIIAGISKNLVEQSSNRLKKDLRIDHRSDRAWNILINPSSQAHIQSIKSSLKQWKDPDWRGPKRTVLVTVMKNSSHLGNLIQVLRELDLSGVPTLIIDDEGDQASLNTHAKSNSKKRHLLEFEKSAIYSRIISLKEIVPHHTLLQYTATPQAPLFINLMDRLSPNFIKLLTPGKDYVGGEKFFAKNSKYVIKIPEDEIHSEDSPLLSPPQSLLKALRYFYIGVAAGLRNSDQGNRSMMVHPSRLTGEHNQFHMWIESTQSIWVDILSEEGENKEMHLEKFYNCFLELKKTLSRAPSWEDIREDLVAAIKYTQIIKVNSQKGKTPSIPWRDHYSFILVGGQALDRGFTVEGLTVTYMPRNLGSGNADTIQQRARFFGYKKSYLGYCRVFLDRRTISAYKQYVEHEEDIRNSLSAHNVSNKHLNNWERTLILGRLLNLCRGNILSERLSRDRFGEHWIWMRSPQESPILQNREIVESFLSKNGDRFSPEEGFEASTDKQFRIGGIFELKQVLNELMIDLKFVRESDSRKYTSLKSLLKIRLEENPDEQCFLYLMGTKDPENWISRERSISKGEVQELFQGRSKNNSKKSYVGERSIRKKGMISFQLHKLNLTPRKGATPEYLDVFTLASWIPKRIGKDIIRKESSL